MGRAPLALFLIALVALLCVLTGERQTLPPGTVGAAPAPLPESVSAISASASSASASSASASSASASTGAAVGDDMQSEVPFEVRTATASLEEGIDAARLELTGRLVDPDGRPIAGVELEYFGRRKTERPIAALLRNTRHSGADARTTSDGSGRFRLAIASGVGGELALPRGGDWLLAETDERFLTIPVQHRDADLGDVPLRLAASVSGVVVDEESRPIAGARIRVSTATASQLATIVSSDPTDDTGAFALRGIDGGSFRVDIRAVDHVPHTLDLELDAGERRNGLRIFLPRGGRVTGQVLDDRGVPVPGARVAPLRSIVLPSGRDFERLDLLGAATTGSDASFALGGLEGDRVRLHVSARLHGERLLDDIAVGSRITVTLPRRAVIQGTLRDPTGRGIEGSQVRVEVRSKDRESSARAPAELARPGIPERTHAAYATTGEGGAFVIEDVAPGEVVLGVTGETHSEVESPPFRVGVGDLLKGIELVALPGAGIEVVVVDRDGMPVVGATVEVARQPRVPPLIRGRTDGAGRWRRTGLPPEDLIVRVDHPDFVAADPIRVRPVTGNVHALDVVLDCGGYLDVRVVDQAGVIGAGCAIALRGPLGTDHEQDRRGETDGDGVAAIGPLRPGSYAVFAMNRVATERFSTGTRFDAGSGVIEASRVAAVVREGERSQIRLIRPSSVAVTGLVRDGVDRPVAGAEITVQGIGREGTPTGTPYTTYSRGDGGYSIEVTSGAWSLRYGVVSMPWRAELVLTVPPGVKRIERDLELPMGSVAVLVVDANGNPVRGATLLLQPGHRSEAPPERTPGRINPRGLAHATTDRSGRATLDAVLAGEYTLEVRGPDLAPARVGLVIREGERTELAPVRLVRVDR